MWKVNSSLTDGVLTIRFYYLNNTSLNVNYRATMYTSVSIREFKT